MQLHKNMKYELIATSNGRLIVGGAVAQAALEAGISIKVIDTPITARWSYEIFSNNFFDSRMECSSVSVILTGVIIIFC